MAKQRTYVYQIKGNKLSLVEVDHTNSGDGLNYSMGAADDWTGENTPFGTSGVTVDLGSGSSLLTSPIADITDGLEIEYVHSPEWSIQPNNTYGSDLWVMNGWTVVDGYLTFLRGDWSNGQAPDWGSLINTATPQYVLIKGSDRWNGVHRVQEAHARTGTSHGGVKTFTKVNQSVGYISEACAFNTNESISAMDEITVQNVITWDHVWTAGGAQGQSVGLFSKPEYLTSGSIDFSSSTSYYVEDIEDQSEKAMTPVFASDSTTHHFYEAFRDPGMKMYLNVDVLNDEDDNINLPRYLAQALVYYVRARIAEDIMELELKEYMMREFRKMVEKHENAKAGGPRRMMPGIGAIR